MTFDHRRQLRWSGGFWTHTNSDSRHRIISIKGHVYMNVEEKRLATFREWPSNATIGASCLAKAGFYYAGRFLEVQCFLCGTRISDWNYGDQAMARHRRKAPTCPFVLDPARTCNVPLIPVTAGSMTSSSSRVESVESPQDSRVASRSSSDSLRKYQTVSQRLQTFDSWPLTSVIRPEQLASAGFYYLQYEDMVIRLLWLQYLSYHISF